MDSLVVEKHAVEFRKRFDMDSDSVVNRVRLLEDTKVITLFKPLKAGFAGMAFKQGDAVFMMINSDHPRGKQNFTICHELYHLMIQEDFTFMQCHSEIFDRKKDKNEYLADLFASHLLIPTDGLLERIPDEALKKRDTISLETVVRTEQYFQCSRTALLYRLKELSLISDEKKEEFSKNVKASALRYGFTEDLYTAGSETAFVGNDYLELVKDLYDKDVISQAHYLEMMHDAGIDLY
jgi:Zn-dependent peptidase ImmA (M78 family)